MPEGIEAEIWRRAARQLLGRRLVRAWVDERVAPPGFVHEVVGATVREVRRRGKMLSIETDGPSIGLHFGMTGRLIVDGHAPIERLEYASARDDPAWDRLRLWATNAPLADVPALRLNDPRRLGRITLDADLSHLGPDAFDVDPDSLSAGLRGRRIALKTALLDQTVVAGLGNLCVDEVLWWTGLAPHRGVDQLGEREIRRLAATTRRRLAVMLAHGGSTSGTLSPQIRRELGPCLRDGAALLRSTVGGRTTVWCGQHQR